ncbi:MAG: COX15/CtaA family protein [Acidimicrobiaceae bacterium]|nr:COX15/CtaA family protein [Ilumatobacteraceae bacterium]
MARVSEKSFRVVTGAALGSLCVIVFTGALVRLTGSGLGCSDWPRCNEEKFVDVSSGHTFIEQANRLFTGVVSASVIAAVLLAHLRRPYRRDLVLLAWSLVIGVLAQVIIGGIVVLTGLNPYANMAHFLVSLVLIASALLLYRRAAVPNDFSWWRSVPREYHLRHGILVVASLVAIVTGTVVTATGPHAGGEDAVRFGFDLVTVARIHSISVLTTVATLLFFMFSVRKTNEIDLRESLNTLAFVAVTQGGVGYLQYFTGVPVVLVAAHIVGAVSFFIAVLNTFFVPLPKNIGAS